MRATGGCKETLSSSVAAIALSFKGNQPLQSEKIVSCFYNCYQKEFIKWASITYKNNFGGSIDFIANTAFTDAVLTFAEMAAAGEIYQETAVIRTILFGIYRNKLRQHLQTEKREAEKKEKYAIGNKEVNTNNEGGQDKEEMFKILEQALEKMEPDDRQIIIWRHIEEKNCDDIASIFAINTTSATNRIYRCMERLRNLTGNANKKA